MSTYELNGKLVEKYPVVQRTETFKTREFVIEKTEDIGNGRIITNYIKLQCVQDKTEQLDKFTIGDGMKISFNLTGRKWSKDGREGYMTNLDAWRMEASDVDQPDTSSQTHMNNAPTQTSTDTDVADDLPF